MGFQGPKSGEASSPSPERRWTYHPRLWLSDVDSAQARALRTIKTSCFANGIRITQAAESRLSEGGRVPLSIHEYATTGGVTIELEGGVYVNAPFDEWFCKAPEVVLDIGEGQNGFVVRLGREEVPARMLRLPGYLGSLDAAGRPISDVAMSHGDRIRLSPVGGCAYACKFCDIPGKRYVMHPIEQVLAALEGARHDKALPTRHLLISGGTPLLRDEDSFLRTCATVAREARMPVDVMMTPREDVSSIDRLADDGIDGFALNLEIFDPETASKHAAHKAKLGRDVLAQNIARAVECTGGKGRVRSLIVVGLEGLEATLEGVEFIARLGCDPVLSPFRPAAGTRLSHVHPPTVEFLDAVYDGAVDIASAYGTMVGPRCVPCQHNTVSFG